MLEIGQTLRNGATVLACTNNVVLALIPGNSITPFATWLYSKADGSDTYWGYYSQTLQQAVSTYEQRTGE